MTVKLSNIIAPSFHGVHKAVKNREFTHYWEKGGRGSTKSSFISIEIPLILMKDPKAHAVVFRKVADTLKHSVYPQIEWALHKLEVSHKWKLYKSPLLMVYKETGQMIYFKGCDDPNKIKSIKPPFGYLKCGWFEELDEFSNMEEIRKIQQSIMRGGNEFIQFCSYNPPKSVNNWVNTEVLKVRKDRLIHSSDYRDVPIEWLGEQFFIEADELKKTDELAYRHEYLGEATGTGGAIFPNVVNREISDKEIKAFDNLRQGIDWGYAVDPFAFTKMHYDKTRKKLYIFDEIYKVGLLNERAIELVKAKYHANTVITADSAEPKSIDEFRNHQINTKGAKKGKDSVRFGIKWLQGLREIVIDPARCPNTLKEFSTYEYERNKDGSFKDKYPDSNNHGIDSVRYALEDDIMSYKIKPIKGLIL